MANGMGGAAHYPGPNNTVLSDLLDWSGAHELGSPHRGGHPRLLPPHALGQLRELTRARLADSGPGRFYSYGPSHPGPGTWRDTGSGPGR